MGRPTKFQPEYQEMLINMAHLMREGITDESLAKVLGVTPQTINNWKHQQPDFFDALKETKAIADDKVEQSLFQRATGYVQIEEKVEFDKEGEVKGSTKITKHLAPDTTASIFWLKNRLPDKWRDVKERKLITDEDDTDMAEVARRLAFIITQASMTTH